MTLDPFAAFRLDGRVAIVTGASSGLGARFARVLDGAGARVVLVARREDRLHVLASELRDATSVVADLADPETPSRIVDATLERFGRLDVLVNNAGTIDVTPALDEPIDTFRRVIDVNLVGTFALTQSAVRAMLAREAPDAPGGSVVNGAVVNVASIWGVVGVGQIPDAAYAASKTGIIGLTRELGAQWARRGVRVNALAPGWFKTEMTDGSMFGDPGAEKWMSSRTPMGRGGAEHELDGALLFLASDASSFVTGATLTVDGGWTAV